MAEETYSAPDVVGDSETVAAASVDGGVVALAPLTDGSGSGANKRPRTDPIADTVEGYRRRLQRVLGMMPRNSLVEVLVNMCVSRAKRLARRAVNVDRQRGSLFTSSPHFPDSCNAGAPYMSPSLMKYTALPTPIAKHARSWCACLTQTRRRTRRCAPRCLHSARSLSVL